MVTSFKNINNGGTITYSYILIKKQDHAKIINNLHV